MGDKKRNMSICNCLPLCLRLRPSFSRGAGGREGWSYSNYRGRFESRFSDQSIFPSGMAASAVLSTCSQAGLPFRSVAERLSSTYPPYSFMEQEKNGRVTL